MKLQKINYLIECDIAVNLLICILYDFSFTWIISMKPWKCNKPEKLNYRLKYDTRYATIRCQKSKIFGSRVFTFPLPG